MIEQLKLLPNSSFASSDRLEPIVTLFALPKSFADNHTALIQRNAITSWTQLGTSVRVILLGDEPGIEEIAAEFGLIHIADLKRNKFGTPLLSDAFARVNNLSVGQLIAYVNSDIILVSDFLLALSSLLETKMEKFLVIGRRIDTDIESLIDFSSSDWSSTLVDFAKATGTQAAVVCKDYFVFPQGQFTSIPEFCVGRGNWDNWMVASTRKSAVPIVDATDVITAIHQNHGYNHVKGGRSAAYVTGVEARENLRLAGGRNLVAGCSADFRFEAARDDPKLIPVKSMAFWRDLPKFLSLVKRLLLER